MLNCKLTAFATVNMGQKQEYALEAQELRGQEAQCEELGKGTLEGRESARAKWERHVERADGKILSRASVASEV